MVNVHDLAEALSAVVTSLVGTLSLRAGCQVIISQNMILNKASGPEDNDNGQYWNVGKSRQETFGLS